MSRRALSALLVTFATLSVFAAQQQRPEEAPAIKIGRGSFKPAAGEAPPVRPDLAIAGYGAGQRGYYLVQSLTPITEAWKAAVTAEGAELLDYVPDFAFKVRMNPAQAARVEKVAGVAWVGL